jgi:predicted extracellular nuclease
MKKILISLTVLALCLFAVACGKTTADNSTPCEPDKECCDGVGNCPNDTDTDTIDDVDTDTDTGDADTQHDDCDDEDCIDDGDTDTADDDDDSPKECDDSVICKIQRGEFKEETTVTTECVVTAVDIKSEKQEDGTYEDKGIKGLYVSEIIPKALPYSGIYVFIKSTPSLNEYKVGDKLEVTGTYKEFNLSSQIEATNIKHKGEAAVPEPAEIEDPSTIATPFEINGKDDNGYDTYEPNSAMSGEDAEKYESVFVKVKDVEVTNKYLGNANFEVTGGLAIAPTLHKYEGDISKGTKFESIQGILIYSFNAFRLAPRSDDDIKEKIIEPTGTSIKDIQSGKKGTGEIVSIENAIVISPVLSKNFNDGGKGYAFYVSDGTTGDYSGLYIYYVSAETAPAKGDKVTIEGQVDFYNNQWEIKNAKSAGSITKTGTGTVPAALEKAYTALSDKDKGSLIEITDELTVKSVEKPEGKNYTKITFEEKVGDKELIAENFGNVTFPDFQAGDKLHVKGIYDVIFGSNGFYIIDANDIDKRIY